jgi:hypothetical protein
MAMYLLSVADSWAKEKSAGASKKAPLAVACGFSRGLRAAKASKNSEGVLTIMANSLLCYRERKRNRLEL